MPVHGGAPVTAVPPVMAVPRSGRCPGQGGAPVPACAPVTAVPRSGQCPVTAMPRHGNGVPVFGGRGRWRLASISIIWKTIELGKFI